jgi:hypothetical protein
MTERTAMRRAAPLLIALIVAACGADAPNSAATDAPAATSRAAATTKATSGPATPVEAPALPPSIGETVLFHLQLATDIDGSGVPIDQTTAFKSGTQTILGLLGWQLVPAGTELKLRLFQGDRFVYETSHTVVNESGPKEDGAGFVYGFHTSAGFADGAYMIEVDYNGVPDEVVPFTVGAGDQYVATLGSGSQSGPIPYADPSSVLVVTRESVLRANLGSRTDDVLAAARRVGDLHDLEEGGTRINTVQDAIDKTQSLLRAGSYKYLLILGNDDAVPFAHLKNPLADSEQEDLADWELPADWVPTDNFYADLDGDQYVTPDIAVARIPSSDDADLLLTQLSDIVPPDGGGFALINQERKSQAGIVLNQVASMAQVRVNYSPPMVGDTFGQSSDAANARYTYVLLHGIGVATDSWATNTVTWDPISAKHPLDDEWVVADGRQVVGVSVDSNPTSHGVVQIGACYGAWTLDTTQAPQHKTADNNLALHYLKSGTRAYIADTHLSYSVPLGPGETPRGRTGFELLFWQAIAAGETPIDAFQTAKVGTAKAIDDLIAAGNIDSAKITLKTLHYMVYLGRP